MVQLIRALVVDDEPLARDGIRLLLREDRDVSVIGEAGDGRRAAAMIAELRPDLVFLDIQMPVLDGFAALDAVPEAGLPAVVFVTAYDRYAIRAFEVHAIDYLLKPFTPQRFQAALALAKEEIAARGSHDARRRLLALLAARHERSSHVQRFVVRAGEGFAFVRASDVSAFEAQGNYIRLTTASGTHLMRMTMTELEKKLDPREFARIHRSAMVNIACIEAITPDPHGDFDVQLAGGRRLRLSRNFRERILT